MIIYYILNFWFRNAKFDKPLWNSNKLGGKQQVQRAACWPSTSRCSREAEAAAGPVASAFRQAKALNLENYLIVWPHYILRETNLTQATFLNESIFSKFKFWLHTTCARNRSTLESVNILLTYAQVECTHIGVEK